MPKPWHRLPLRTVAGLVKPLFLLLCFMLSTWLLLYNLAPQGDANLSGNNLSVLWYTSLEQGAGATGFIQESLNFMLPLSEMMSFGWYAGSSISDVKTNSFFTELSTQDQGTLLKLLLKGAKINHELPSQNKVIVVTFEQPSQYEAIFQDYRMKHAVYKVGRAMFETDWIPKNWEYHINEYLDELWVPSSFTKQVFQAAGVYKPIKIIREGFDPEPFATVLNETETKNYRKKFYSQCRESDVIFLSVGKMERRKGVDILVNTWIEQFKRTDPACLYIRASMNGGQRKSLTSFMASGLRVFEMEILSYEELALAYQSADVFVLPTHGEGWGRPIMEAMAAGLPAIVPLWSGITEFVREEYSIPLHVAALEPAFKGDEWAFGGSRYQNLHHWAAINKTELGHLLAWCLDHPQQLIDIGTKAKAAMYKSFTRDAVSRDAKYRIDEIQQEIRGRGVDVYQRKNEIMSKAREIEARQNQMKHIETMLESSENIAKKVGDIETRAGRVEASLSRIAIMLNEQNKEQVEEVEKAEKVVKKEVEKQELQEWKNKNYKRKMMKMMNKEKERSVDVDVYWNSLEATTRMFD